MKRTAFLRKAPNANYARVKPKKCRAPGCRKEYVPHAPFVTWCSPDCATVIALAKLAKMKAAQAKKAAAEKRVQSRQQKLATEKTSVKESRLQDVVNAIARVRDHEYGCISCDKPQYWAGGAWHGSHFKSVGSNSALRYNLLNIHKACDQCNYFQAGNIANYETRLRQKIGDERVDWLKNHPRSREYSRDWLDRAYVIASKYLKRLRRRKGL